MATIKATTNAHEVAQWLDKTVLKQMHFAKVVALNRTAKIVKEGEQDVMRARFDRPTPYALNSLFTMPAKKNQSEPFAKVYFKDESFKGTPATKFLWAGVHGGERKHKRFEKALINRGLMKSSQFATPAAGAKLDQYGNVRRGQIVQVLSALRAFGEQGYDANRTGSKRSQRKVAGSDYFVGNPGGEGDGIWQRVQFGHGTGVKPIFMFANAPKYRVILPFSKIAENMTNKHLPVQYAKAFDEAMKSAR